MAMIDFKKAKLLIRDGTAPTAQTNAVNHLAGYTLGYTGAIAYDGTGTLSVGLKVSIGSHSYYIASLGTNTVTFTAPLKAAIADNDVINSNLYTNEIRLKLGAGNLTFSEKQTIEYVLDAGRIDEVRQGDEVPMDVSLSCNWMEYTGSVAVEDALAGINTAAAWISSDTADPCRPYAVDLVFEYDPGCGTIDPFVYTLPYFRWESKDFDMRAGTFSVTGKCNARSAILES